jgi:uncharacterized protein (TIGR02452 family)
MRKSLAQTAQETLEVLEHGRYAALSGQNVDVRAALDAAVRATVTYEPSELESLLRDLPMTPGAPLPVIELTAETTVEAGRRLVQREQVTQVVALNFASAKNPGGGFLSGARAQEEELARCSGLYACLRAQRLYYDRNRAEPSLFYTDHMIYSPSVPFFRDETLRLVEQPFPLSIITAPAPNAGVALSRDPDLGDALAAVLAARARKVLAVAAKHRHRCVILGAWGCGVFRNEPAVVARAFAEPLRDGSFSGAFDRVVFAVYDPGGRTLSAFEHQFGPARI